MVDSITLIGEVIRLGAASAALVIIFAWVVSRTRADEFRQEVFALRRRLFLAAVDGEVRFDDPAYEFLRTTMNGMIRYAERVTMARVLLVGVIAREASAQFGVQAARAFTETPDAARRVTLTNYQDELTKVVMRHLVLTSPVGWAFWIAAIACSLWRFGVRRSVQDVPDAVRHVVRLRTTRQAVANVEYEAYNVWARDSDPPGRPQAAAMA